LEDPLADDLLRGKVLEGVRIQVDLDEDGNITFATPTEADRSKELAEVN
jgi:hypothetical protein